MKPMNFDKMFRLTNNNKAIIGTVLFHGLLLLCFFIMGFKTPLPLPVEQELEIEMDDGGGGGGGSSSQESAVESAPPSEEEYVTQDTDETDAVAESKVNKTKTEPKNIEPQVNKLLLYKKGGNSNGGGTGTGSGSGNGSGIGPGSGSGDGGGSGSGHGTGTGAGNGPGFSLTGRQSKSLPAPDFSNIQGKVVVRIRVNPSGKVVDAEAISKGSTIADPKVWRKCEAFAMRATFSPKPDAPEEQQGTITYIIK